VCCATTSGPTYSPWAVKRISKLSDEAHSPDGKRIWLGPGAQRRRFRRCVLAALVVFSLVFTNRLTVAVPLTAAAVLPLTSMASSATTSLFNVAGGYIPVAFLVWSVNSKLESVIEMLRRDVKRQVDETNTELGADRASLIQQRGLLNHVRVNLAANEDVPDTP
jgi:hypothetical protein